MKPSGDHDIRNEPHLRAGGFRADPSEDAAAQTLAPEAARNANNPDAWVDQSVWNEPGVEGAAAGVPVLDYAHWLEGHRAATTPAESWGRVILLMLVAGPWAIIGAMFGRGESFGSALALILGAPVIEEMLKVAAALYVVERRPFWFISPGQIVLCGMASGFCFAAIENVLYLFVYIENPTPWLWVWRWTVCVALHVVCSLVASLGLVRAWKQVWSERRLGGLEGTVPFLVAAMIIHGVYNAFAVVFDLGFLRH